MGNMNIFQSLEAGLSAVDARQQAIAKNLANINTEGYRRQDVKFEEFLARAMDGGGKSDPRKIKPEFFSPMETAVKPNGNDVNLEMEIGKMVTNTGKYKAYMKVPKKLYAQLDMAMGK